jgi:hypothetical protein
MQAHTGDFTCAGEPARAASGTVAAASGFAAGMSHVRKAWGRKNALLKESPQAARDMLMPGLQFDATQTGQGTTSSFGVVTFQRLHGKKVAMKVHCFTPPHMLEVVPCADMEVAISQHLPLLATALFAISDGGGAL